MSRSTAPWFRIWSSTAKSFVQHFGPFHILLTRLPEEWFSFLRVVLIPILALRGSLPFLLEIRNVCLVLVMTPPFSTAASLPLSSHTHPQFPRFYQPHSHSSAGFFTQRSLPGLYVICSLTLWRFLCRYCFSERWWNMTNYLTHPKHPCCSFPLLYSCLHIYGMHRSCRMCICWLSSLVEGKF